MLVTFYKNSVTSAKTALTEADRIINSSKFNNLNFAPISSFDSLELGISKALNKFEDFSIKEYKTLSAEEKGMLRETYKKFPNFEFHQNVEETHEKVSEEIKRHLDEKYGEGKYSVVTIGRSLSSIGKVLGYKIGENRVINIPMTDAKRYNNDRYLENLKGYGSMLFLRKYLGAKGLKKADIELSDKKYVLMDYCHSGDSLKGAYNLLTREDVLGKKNIDKMDVMACIKNEKLSHNLNVDLALCHYKRYSFVDCANNVFEMPSAQIDTKKANIEKKLMWFKLLDNQMTKV